MPLTPGTRLGPYEITAPLGAGGMGEVYRARDSRLGRDVAVKVLPASLSRSPESRARFEREARTISALNHPNICTLFDVGREADTDFLVMELVEGETLAARLARGALPVADVLRIGAEVTDALDRAHGAGVVHRDLKPGNVMLTRSGAKLMDFGLARATGMAGPAAGSGVTVAALTQSPTMAAPLTAEGTIVGTFQYMAPEQLEGREADARSDLWALGCVLYEMATGRRAFEGKSQASLITAIMGAQPEPISRVAPLAPPGLERLVAACLAKDPADRLQSAHDLRIQLAWLAEGGSQAGVPAPVRAARRGRERLAWLIAAVAVVAAAAATFLALRPAPGAPPVHATLLPPAGVTYSSSVDSPMPLAISPDGRVVAFCGRTGEGPDVLWVRTLGKDDARALAGTEEARGPFFSPDGRSLAFYTGDKLKRVDVAGGPVVVLGDNIDARGGTWNRDGDILFARSAESPIFRIPANGGAMTAVTALDSTLAESTHRYPLFLPDGRHFLYLARRAGAGSGESPTIFAGSLGSSRRKAVLEAGSNVIYASGHLLFVRGGILVAQRFDTRSLSVSGPVVPLVDDVRMDPRYSRGVFAASQNGILVCMTGNTQTRSQLRWLDRSGRNLGDVGEPADYTYGGTPNVSPDGRSALMPIGDPARGLSDVWHIDLASGRLRKLTVDGLDHPAVAWCPDGRSAVVMTHDVKAGGVQVMAIDGTWSRRILSSTGWAWPMGTGGDRVILAPEKKQDQSDTDLMELSLAGADSATSLAATRAVEYSGQYSPDLRWVAYTSNETGRFEIFVTARAGSGGRWQVSQSGGVEPRWSRDGRELFYLDRENHMVSVEVLPSTAGFEAGAAHTLFQIHGSGGLWRYDVTPDGRFLVCVRPESDLISPVTLITDWTRRVATK